MVDFEAISKKENEKKQPVSKTGKPATINEYGIRFESKRLGVGLQIADAGSFYDKDKKENVDFDAFIKINSGKFDMKISALQLLFLHEALDVPEVRAEIMKRAAVERAELLADIGGLMA